MGGLRIRSGVLHGCEDATHHATHECTDHRAGDHDLRAAFCAAVVVPSNVMFAQRAVREAEPIVSL